MSITCRKGSISLPIIFIFFFSRDCSSLRIRSRENDVSVVYEHLVQILVRSSLVAQSILVYHYYLKCVYTYVKQNRLSFSQPRFYGFVTECLNCTCNDAEKSSIVRVYLYLRFGSDTLFSM